MRENGYTPSLKGLFEKRGVLTKEGSGVFSTVSRQLSWLDSEMVARTVESSTFDVLCLLQPGVTLYIQIPPEQLEAQRNLLRCWLSTVIRVVGSGSEEVSEVLLLCDEASALGSLPALEEALIRGRSSGLRILLAYQSFSQIQAAFKDKPTLILDNCGVQIHMGPASSLEAAERLSKSVGDFTQVVDSYGQNWNRSSSSHGDTGSQSSRGESLNYAQLGRALLKPEEILSLSEDELIAFVRGMPAPILAKRITWFADRGFNPAAKKHRDWRWMSKPSLVWLLFAIAFGVLVIRAKTEKFGYWAPEVQKKGVMNGKAR
jgi:type IV secretion system protein VirD4